MTTTEPPRTVKELNDRRAEARSGHVVASITRYFDDVDSAEKWVESFGADVNESEVTIFHPRTH